MAEPLPISGLPAASLPFQGDELLPVVQAGVTCQAPAVAFGVPVGEFTVFNRGTDIPGVVLYEVPADGLYVIAFVLACTAPQAGSGAQVLKFHFEDVLGPQDVTVATLELTAQETDEGSLIAFCRNSTAISFSCEQAGAYNLAEFFVSVLVLRLS